MNHKIMIVTGEASGDLHGANLVKAMLSIDPELQFCGMGGSELASLGVEILYDAAKVSVVGIFEVFSHLKDIWLAQQVLRRRLAADPPDLLVLIDLPDFNLLLAKNAKKHGIPVFYYISPQLWAWRSGRVKTMKARVDKIGVILPFEEEFYCRRGIAAQYVGHPLLDTVKTTATREQFLHSQNISYDTRCIGVFPGSRKREVASLLPIFLGAADDLQQSSPEKIVFFIPRASTISQQQFAAAGLNNYQHLDIRIIEENRYNMMAACDAVMTASGTVTLELAILEVPMIVAYKLAPLTYQLAKRLVRVDFFTLVNLIAGYAAVPELLQHDVTAEKIAAELSAITTLPARKEEMKRALKAVRGKLGESGASAKAAAVALEMLALTAVNVDDSTAPDPIALAIDGVLDLHPFSPKDLKTLIPDYLSECRKKGILEVKIIHGKGIGNIRRSVHALLERNPLVASYRQAELHSGGWGATIVCLKVDKTP